MQIYIVILFLSLVKAAVFSSNTKCVTVHGTKYEEELLKDGVHNPYQLAIDYDTNTLFFSYTAKTTETFKIAYLSLKTNDYGLVTGIKGGFAIAINTETHEVFMGGEDGLYKFDYTTKSASKLNGITDKNIWQMFYKDGLYFTTYPQEKAFLYKNNNLVEVPELKYNIMLLAVKNDGNYVYYNSSGLFMYDKTLLKSMNIADRVVNGITADIDGNLYFSSPGGIYYINPKNNEIEELFTDDNIYGVVVEGNGNIIYAKDDSIVRLIPTKKDCWDKDIVQLIKVP